MDKKQERMVMFTFWACLFVLLVNLASLVVNWKLSVEREKMWVRIVALENAALAIRDQQQQRQRQ